MAGTLSSIALELLSKIGLFSDLDGFIRLRSTGREIRQKLVPGPTVVEVGRLLFPFCKN